MGVNALGEVTVRAPYSLSIERIEAFLEKKSDWIAKHQRRAELSGVRLPSEDLDGYVLPFLGGEYIVCLCEERSVRLDEQGGRVFVPRQGGEKRLTAWLKAQAKAVFDQTVAVRARQMGVTVRSVCVSSARTRWGTCSAKDEIRLCFRLLYCPMEILDYVVVHELAHICVKNHSAAFWAQVAAVLPDYRQKRKWLKERSALMQIF